VVVREAKAEEGKLVRTTKQGATFFGAAPDGASSAVRPSFVVASDTRALASAARAQRHQQSTINQHRGGPCSAIVQHNKALKAFASLTGTSRLRRAAP